MSLSIVPMRASLKRRRARVTALRMAVDLFLANAKTASGSFMLIIPWMAPCLRYSS